MSKKLESQKIEVNNGKELIAKAQEYKTPVGMKIVRNVFRTTKRKK